MNYKEALQAIKEKMDYYESDKRLRAAIETLVPELCESEDERIRKELIEAFEAYDVESSWNLIPVKHILAWLEKQKDAVSNAKYIEDVAQTFEDGRKKGEKQKEPHYTKRNALFDKCVENCEPKTVEEVNKRVDDIMNMPELSAFEQALTNFIGYWEDDEERWPSKFVKKYGKHILDMAREELQKEQKPIKMGVYEIGKGTTICGQDYKCKKDYKIGACRYIKDAIYHCSRDGYLNDQNGVSWSCTPEWFNEYIQSNTEWAEEEKTRFVSGQFLQCKLSFDEFKEGEHYWLEYVGDDMYVGRSDNVLNQRFHITPRQLYTLFSQKLEEVQGPPQEEKQVSLNYEPPFNENPSDNEIIEALIKYLEEQDGFLTAIDCVSTKAILSWLEKQKEQKPAEWSKEDEDRIEHIIGSLESLKVYVRRNVGMSEEYKEAIFKRLEQEQSWLKDLTLSLKKSNEDIAKLCSNEWSEEDEKILDWCESVVRGFEIDHCNDDKLHSDWLKLLKNRGNFLKSNTNSHSWKPSEEQMKVDLGAEIEMEWDSFSKHIAEYGEESDEVVWLNRFSFVDIANYFYELGKNSK